jgi:hypothetical protein
LTGVAALRGQYLNHQLECTNCGTIRLEIPERADEKTLVRCSSCGREIGAWGDLQDDFQKQSVTGVFDLQDGKIREV